MAGKLDLYLEAEKRGILPDDKRALLDEARKRGLVPLQPELGGLPVDASPTQYAAQSAGAAQQPEPLDLSAAPEGIRAQIQGMPEALRPEAMQQWQESRVQQDRASPDLNTNPVATGLRQFARGTLAGSFLDEADAALNSVTHSVSGGKAGVPYDEALEYNRARNRADDKDFGGYGTGLKIAGGLLTGAPIAKKFVSGAKSALGRLGRIVGAGGAAGGTYGFGEGEGLENRLEGAETGAKWGAGLSLALPIAGKGGAFLAQKGADFLPAVKARLPISKVSNPDSVATDWLASKIRRSGQTPQDIADDLAEGERASRLGSNSKLGYADVNEDNVLLPEMIGDTSDTLRRLMGTVYRTGNEAGEIVKGRLESRQRGPDNFYAPRADQRPQGQIERVLDTYDRAMQIRTKGSARQNEKAIIQAQKTKGDQLYSEARNGSEPFDLTPVIQKLDATVQTYPPPFAAKLLAARDLFVRPVKVKGQTLTQPVDNVTLFDNAKKALDDMIASAKKSEPNLARELTKLKNELLEQVHAPSANGGPRKNVKYQEARDTWGSEAENLEAIELGRRALKEDSDVSVEMFRELNPAQQKLFRIGMRDAIRRAYGAKDTGADVTRLFDQRRVKELMAEAIPRTKAKKGVFADRPERFGEVMRREGRMVQSRNEAVGNSKTDMRKQDSAEFASDALGQMLAGGRSVTNYVLEAVGAGLSKFFGYRADVAKSLAQKLTTTDPAERARVLSEIQQQMGPSKWAEFSRWLGHTAGLAVTPTAVQANMPPATGQP
jgi:hypothetical protein